jgi:hypothetical protein
MSSRRALLWTWIRHDGSCEWQSVRPPSVGRHASRSPPLLPSLVFFSCHPCSPRPFPVAPETPLLYTVAPNNFLRVKFIVTIAPHDNPKTLTPPLSSPPLSYFEPRSSASSTTGGTLHHALLLLCLTRAPHTHPYLKTRESTHSQDRSCFTLRGCAICVLRDLLGDKIFTLLNRPFFKLSSLPTAIPTLRF